MLRLILAILAGFAITAILSTAADLVCHAIGIFPPYDQPFFETGPFLLATAYRAIFQVAGAYCAALIAREKAKTAVWFIGSAGTILWLVGAVMLNGMGPLWYPIVGALLSIPTVLTGYALYQRRKAAQPASH